MPDDPKKRVFIERSRFIDRPLHYETVQGLFLCSAGGIVCGNQLQGVYAEEGCSDIDFLSIFIFMLVFCEKWNIIWFEETNLFAS